MDISACGTDCAACQFFDGLCKGCNALKGMPFYYAEGKHCSIYVRCTGQKRFSGSTGCEAVPCMIWQSIRVPGFSDAKSQKNVGKRFWILKNWGEKICSSF